MKVSAYVRCIHLRSYWWIREITNVMFNDYLKAVWKRFPDNLKVKVKWSH